MDLMGTAGQTCQHGARRCKINRLPEQLAIEVDHGIDEIDAEKLANFTRRTLWAALAFVWTELSGEAVGLSTPNPEDWRRQADSKTPAAVVDHRPR